MGLKVGDKVLIDPKCRIYPTLFWTMDHQLSTYVYPDRVFEIADIELGKLSIASIALLSVHLDGQIWYIWWNLEELIPLSKATNLLYL